jgi:hypothetical protein
MEQEKTQVKQWPSSAARGTGKTTIAAFASIAKKGSGGL